MISLLQIVERGRLTHSTRQTKKELATLMVDRGSIARPGDRLTRLVGSYKPVLFGLLELGQRLLRRVAEGGAGEEVWDISHVAAVTRILVPAADRLRQTLITLRKGTNSSRRPDSDFQGWQEPYKLYIVIPPANHRLLNDLLQKSNSLPVRPRPSIFSSGLLAYFPASSD